MYTMEEVREKLNAILQADNPGTTSEILVDLQNNYSSVVTQVADLETKVGKLAKDNADLILANGKLFQSVGVAKETTKEEQDTEDPRTVEEVLEEMLEGGK